MPKFIAGVLILLMALVASPVSADTLSGYELPAATQIPQLGNQADIPANQLLSSGQKPSSVWDNSTTYPYLYGFSSVDTQNTSPELMYWGGQTYDNKVMIHQFCQTYSGGDLGGTCFQIDNRSGTASGLRNPDNLGVTATTLKLTSGDNHPRLTLGGNAVTLNVFGNVSDVGNKVTTVGTTAAGSTSLVITGPAYCGNTQYGRYCDIARTTATPFTNDAGSPSSTGKFKTTVYNQSANTTTITLMAPLSAAIPDGTFLEWRTYAPDGVAYGVIMKNDGAIIYPTLSTSLQNLLRPRMSVFTNVSNGMAMSSALNQPQLPDYYYGFISSLAATADGGAISGTRLSVATMPDVNSTHISGEWRAILEDAIMPDASVAASYQRSATTVANVAKGDTIIPINIQIPDTMRRVRVTVSGDQIPGMSGVLIQNGVAAGVQLDVGSLVAIPSGTIVTIVGMGVDGTTAFAPGNLVGDKIVNTGTLPYPAPTLAFGMSLQDVGISQVQEYDGTADSVLKVYDNQHLFNFTTSSKNEAISRGLTMQWTANNKLADSSYMAKLDGDGQMPVGLQVSGVYPGGLGLTTDWGLQSFNRIGTTATPNFPIFGTSFGALPNVDKSYSRLTLFESSDVGSTSSFHVGMIKGDATLGSDQSVLCATCTAGGQLLFDVGGASGTVGLGVGLGQATVVGLYVDNTGMVHFPHGYDSSGPWGLTLDSSTDTVLLGSSTTPDLGLQVMGIPLASLKAITAPTPLGILKYCSDCSYHGVIGSFVKYNATTKSWVDLDGMTLTTSAWVRASLPTGGVSPGAMTFCSDCYSKLREDGDTTVGIMVKWTGQNWYDLTGIALP